MELGWPADGERGIPRLGVFFAVVFAMVSLALFVNFIHSITKSIQVDHVLESIFLKTMEGLETRLERVSSGEELPELPDTQGWSTLLNDRTGYYKKCNTAVLLDLMEEQELRLVTLVERGDFVVAGRPLVKVDQEPSEEVKAAILDCFVFYIEEYTHDHFVFGFGQLSEIAVKALSPGINDPGPATRAVDLLSVLLGCYASYPDHDAARDGQGSPRVFFDELDFGALLMRTYGPIRHYGRGDAVVVGKLIESCVNIGYGELSAQRRDVLVEFVCDLIAVADTALEGRMDRRHVNAQIRLLRQLAGGAQELPLLELSPHEQAA